MKPAIFIIVLLAVSLCWSCEKGYRLRVSNFYTMQLDSVIIGGRALIFTDIDTLAATDFEPITSGQHAVTCVAEDGTRFAGLAPLKKGGGGDHTLQIDGTKKMIVLKEENNQ